MNKLTIALSGRKQAGKNTACNLIVAKYLNLLNPDGRCHIDYDTGAMIGPDPGFYDANAVYRQITDEFAPFGVKVYSFADPLKRFLIDVFNVPYESCYGTDAQKNAPIEHLLWDNLPEELRETAGLAYTTLLTGPMTGREIMQIFGTDICRRIYGDCWARGTYNVISNDGHELALVCDGRFPNEILLGSTVGAKSIRLRRNIYNDNHRSETALDGFPLEDYSLAVDNQNLSIRQTCELLSPVIDQWFQQSGIDTQERREKIGRREHGVFS